MRALSAELLLAITLVGAASACGPNAGTPTPPPAATSAAPTPSPTQVSSRLPGSNAAPDSQPAIDAAVADAASHLGVSPSELHVERVEPHQWPDSSLGCPKPGLMYSQIVTPGFLIVISSTSGKQLEYHTDARARVVLCQES